ncbi:hypothetical protein [Falsiroseomonas sp. HW251]|uniref:hypothetical protein n=1 Tax=Falsiroseomonas sp. HW251 TaxID=3390998 RepID=UPI003D31598F
MRQALIGRRLLLLLPLAGCVADPAASWVGGIGDPVRGAALNAPRLLGDMARYRGDPAGAALAAVQLEFLDQQFRINPLYMNGVTGPTLATVRAGRTEMRAAIGIARDAPPELVIAQLREAAAEIQAGSMARADAALSGPMFPLGGEATLRRLSSLPSLPRVRDAAGAANQAITQDRRSL